MGLRILKSKRILFNLTQEEIAKEVGINIKSYNFKENGKVGFNVDEILKVIECLDLTFDEVNDIFFFNKLPKS